MAPKILVVLTSHDKIPSTGAPTGWYLPEFAHPYEVLKDHAELVIASPKGGEAPLDPSSVKAFADDPIATKFLKEQTHLWTNTRKLSDVASEADTFDAIFYVGGHGPMWDLYSDETSLALIQTFSEAGKVVSAVCHGPVALIKAKSASGEPLLSSAQVTVFSNVEEDQTGMTAVLPFLPETELNKISGGGYVKADQPFGEKVVVSKAHGSGAPLITGQNPASATAVAKAVLAAVQK